MPASGKRKKSGQPTTSRTSRVLTLTECRLISTELLLGNTNKRIAYRKRDHCLFWFLTMTGVSTCCSCVCRYACVFQFRISEALTLTVGQIYDPVLDRIKNDVCISGNLLKGSGHTVRQIAARKKRRLEAKVAKGKVGPPPAVEEKKDDSSPFAALPPELRAFMEKALAEEKAKTVAAQKAAAEAEAKQRALEEKLVVKTPKEQELEVKLAAAQAVIAAAEEQKRAGSKKKNPPKARAMVLRPELREMLLRICSGRSPDDRVYRSGVSEDKPITDKAFMKILKDAAKQVFRKEADRLGLEGKERTEFIESRDHVGTNSCRKVFVQQLKIYFNGDGLKADQCLHTQLTVAQHYQRLTKDEIKEAILGCDFGVSHDKTEKKKDSSSESSSDSDIGDVEPVAGALVPCNTPGVPKGRPSFLGPEKNKESAGIRNIELTAMQRKTRAGTTHTKKNKKDSSSEDDDDED